MIVSDSVDLKTLGPSEGSLSFTPKMTSPRQKTFASSFASALSKAAVQAEGPPKRGGAARSTENGLARREAVTSDTQKKGSLNSLGDFASFREGEPRPSSSEMDVHVNAPDLFSIEDQETEADALWPDFENYGALSLPQEPNLPNTDAGGDVTEAVLPDDKKLLANERALNGLEPQEVGLEEISLPFGAKEDIAVPPPQGLETQGNTASRVAERDDSMFASPEFLNRGGERAQRTVAIDSAKSQEISDDREPRDESATMIEQMMFTLMTEAQVASPVAAEAFDKDAKDAGGTPQQKGRQDFASEPMSPSLTSHVKPDNELLSPEPKASALMEHNSLPPERFEAMNGEMPIREKAPQEKAPSLQATTPERDLRPLIENKEQDGSSRVKTAGETREGDLNVTPSTIGMSPQYFATTNLERANEVYASARVIPVDDLHQGLAEVVAQGTDRIQLRVAPPGLGELNIHVRLENGMVRLHVMGSAPELETHLNANLHGLRQELETRGLALGEMTYSGVSDFDSSEQSRSFDRQPQEQNQDRSFFSTEPRSENSSPRGKTANPRLRTQRIDIVI